MTSTRRRVRRGLFAFLLALVVGVFAFAPAAVERHYNTVPARPHPPPSARAIALHRRLTIVDLHADSLLWARDLDERSTRGHVDVPRLIEGNVAIEAFTVVTKSPRGLNNERNDDRSDMITALAIAERWPPRTWTSLRERALYQARKLQDTAARSDGRLTLLRTRDDVTRYLERRRTQPAITAGFLGLEGAHALEGDLQSVDTLFAAGFRMIAPTHFFDTEWAGSAHGVSKGGLTERGRALVRRLEERRILLDLAHASPRTIADAVAMAQRPVVVSHTGVKGTCDNIRNLSDDELRGVARTGGLIGIGFWGPQGTGAVCGGDAAAVARAIRYAVQIVGVEHVALGSDWDGTVPAPFDAVGIVELTDALLAAGFGEADIEKVMGGNAVRLLATALP
jgi:microsomal dipeptidase-like Zn-dependent dipeptidase